MYGTLQCKACPHALCLGENAGVSALTTSILFNAMGAVGRRSTMYTRSLWAACLVCAFFNSANANAATPARPFESPEAFIAEMSKGALLPQFDEDKLQKLVLAYNTRQLKKFKLNPDNPGALPADFSELNLGVMGDYFALNFKKVEKAHTDGIDDGEDSYVVVFFSKATLARAAYFDGPAYAFPDASMQLAVPTRSTCIGEVPTGRIAVHDLSNSKSLFRGELPAGTLSIDVEPSKTPHTLVYKAMSEVVHDEPGRTCEVGLWAHKTQTVVELACDRTAQKCVSRQVSVQRSQGCQSIGGCD